MIDNNKDIAIKYRILSSEYLAKCEECERLKMQISVLEGQVESASEGTDAAVKSLEERNSELVSGLSKAIEEKDSMTKRALRAEENFALKARECDCLRADLDSTLEDNSKLRYENAQLKETLKPINELMEQCKRENVDLERAVELARYRKFNTNSDRSAFMNGFTGTPDEEIERMGLEKYIRMLEKSEGELPEDNDQNNDGGTESPEPDKPEGKDDNPAMGKEGQQTAKKPNSQRGNRKKRYTYTVGKLKRMGMDVSKLPPNAQLIKSRDPKNNKNVWWVRIIYYQKAKLIMKMYKVGHFRMPNGEKPKNSVSPKQLVKRCPVSPSFARFYLEQKFLYNRSEGQILKMVSDMNAYIPQETLNDWMHKIMRMLRKKMLPVMLKEIRDSVYTQNDETIIKVRSREDTASKFKYNTEYIHGVLSPSKRLTVMLYQSGSRAHDIQENLIFKDSKIKAFTADRASLYTTIAKDLEEYMIVRAACWFHARHYFADAFVGDPRVAAILRLINALFKVEAESFKLSHTPEQRLRYRKAYSKGIVDIIFKKLELMKSEGTKYGALVQKAVNYMLDDKDAFYEFLNNGFIEMSNIAAERMFRHIAMGRRNWIHAGSHDAAENIAFMYSLVESCKMNGVIFGDYIEDILNRILDDEKGELSIVSILPNNYRPNSVKKDIV